MVEYGKSVSILVKVFVFGQKRLYSAKVVVFGQSACVRAKVVVLGQICCIRAKVDVFVKKLMYSGKSGCIWAKRLF